jgi:hypothetical protein
MTPTEIIRSQPFKYAAHMTPADEAWVAAHMFRDVTQEQRNNDNTPGKLPHTGPIAPREFIAIPPQPEIKVAKIVAARIASGLAQRKEVIRLLSNGPLTVDEIHSSMTGVTKTQRNSLRGFLKLMATEGYVTCQRIDKGKVRRATWSWTGKRIGGSK